MAENSNTTTLSRRQVFGVVAGATAATALPPLAMPVEADPIFGAIKRHRMAWDRLGVTCVATDRIDARQTGREITDADIEAHEIACGQESDLLDALLTTVPQTGAGVRAALEHLIEVDSLSSWEDVDAFVATLLKSPVLAI